MDENNAVFVSWTRGNPRTRDLGKLLGMDVVFIRDSGNVLVRYIKQAFKTSRYIAKHRPRTLMVMLPPFPLLLLVVMLRRILGYQLIADMHTGAFGDPKWAWSRAVSLRLLRGHTALVTNEFLANECDRYGVRAEVMHDPISGKELNTPCTEAAPKILCPLSYANDEPIEEILGAARRTPRLQWVFTGNAPESVKVSAPPNVVFTGFVTDDGYLELLSESAVVIALTNRPHTMQRAGYEALSFGIPQVTSRFPELQDFLGDAAVYSELVDQEIAIAVTRIINDQDSYRDKARLIRKERIREQDVQLAKVVKIVHDGGQ